MRNTRRAVGIGGLVVLLAAAVAWYRFTPGEPPAGQPPLVTIDAEAIEDLREDFNGRGHETAIVVLLSPT